ncbi:MAG: Hsp20/alpha crystallin family protein, partial [Chloroflexi bacterium]|nr:Hsp20/alpha crystallin family protein [Chloroflexota bacterium]
MTSMIRWTPRRVAPRSSARSVEKLFDEMWRGMSPSADTLRPMVRPAMDVVENEDTVTVRVDLPGLSADDVHVEVEGDLLTISGERIETVEQGNGDANGTDS